MKRVSCLLISIFIVLVVGISSVRAEDYVSSDFPPEKIFIKVVDPDGDSDGGIKIIGKFKNQDGSYTVFCLLGKRVLTPIQLIKLDTNKWVFCALHGNRYGLLQK